MFFVNFDTFPDFFLPSNLTVSTRIAYYKRAANHPDTFPEMLQSTYHSAISDQFAASVRVTVEINTWPLATKSNACKMQDAAQKTSIGCRLRVVQG